MAALEARCTPRGLPNSSVVARRARGDPSLAPNQRKERKKPVDSSFASVRRRAAQASKIAVMYRCTFVPSKLASSRVLPPRIILSFLSSKVGRESPDTLVLTACFSLFRSASWPRTSRAPSLGVPRGQTSS